MRLRETHGGAETMRLVMLTAATAMMICCTARAADEVMLFPILKDGNWGYMDQKGKVVIEPQYYAAWDFHEGLACVAVKALRGYIDATGQMVIKPQFGWAGNFSEGLAWVNLHKNMYGEHVEWYRAVTGTGYCGKDGTTKRFGGKRAAFSEGVVWTNGKYFDKEGKAVSCEAEEGSMFSEGLAAAREGNQWGYLTRDTMKFAIQPQFAAARPFSDGMAAVAEGNASVKAKERNLKWGYVDKGGKIVIERRFEDAGLFSEGLAPVCGEKKWGYVDKSGKTVIEPKYDWAWPFSEGVGRVLSGGKHGYVDKAGNMVIEPKYDAAWEFSKGLARVGLGDKEGYIDHAGKYVWEPTE